MTEEWKVIKDFEEYEVSSFGNIRNTKTLQQLKNCPYEAGSRISLHKGGKSLSKYVHILVAEAFLPKRRKENVVIHINGNRLDNRVANLKWVTGKERHRKLQYRAGRPHKKVNQYDLDGKLVMEWNSVNEAAEFYGFAKGSIRSACNLSRIYMNYFWKYLDDQCLNGETWRTVLFDGNFIRVSSYGRYETDFGQKSKGCISHGYLVARLGGRQYKIDRVVCSAFYPIENPYKYEVIHKDGNVLNNRADNLEWK